MVLSFFVGVVLLVGIYTFMQTPIYRGSAILQIIQDNPSAILGDRPDPLSSMYGYDSQNKFYETQYILLKSRPMATKIVESLRLTEHPQYSIKNNNVSPTENQRIIIDQLMTNLTIKPLKKSFLVEVMFDTPDQNLAQQIPNAIYREYLNFSMDTRRQSYVLIREWLENELQQLANKVETSERKIYENARKKDFLPYEGEDNVVLKKYVELNKVLTTAQSERAVKESQYRQIKDKGVDAPLITNHALIQKVREDVIVQEAKVSSINKIYGENHPQFQAEQARLNDLRGRLNIEVKRIQTSIKSDYEIALRTENLLREELEKQKDKVQSLQNNMVQHNILKRDLQSNEQLYQALLARMKEASVASTMVASNVAVISPAEKPLLPVKPRKLLNMSLALLIGLFGGVGLAFLVEYFDNSIKTTQELERFCRIPSLGVVPLLGTDREESIAYASRSNELMLATYNKPKSMISEAIHQVSTSVMLSFSGSPPRTIVITSPNPGEGKTTVSVNLASELAMGGRRVLLIDADLRKPSIHHAFNLPGKPGLSNFLAGNASKAEIIMPTFIPTLFFIPAGTVPPNPMQLLNSEPFKELLNELRQDFENVIFDTPPVIGFADGRVISSMVDGVLMVLRHHYTSRDAGRLAAQLLYQANASLLGGILNMALPQNLGYGGYSNYYKHYSRYYSKYIDS
jgi:capsular exopolysaccharide synthesis family protein